MVVLLIRDEPAKAGWELNDMSMYYMIHGEPEIKVYDDGRTKQSFKAETDINTILGKYMKTGVISHMNKFQPLYGEFADVNLAEAMDQVQKGYDIFAALPAEVRREFDQNPDSFFSFVNDPENSGRLEELLPGIAAKGDYFVDVSSDTPPGELVGGGEPGGKKVAGAEEVTKDDKAE